jgi:sulfite exporter TauE/SafE
MDLAAVNSPETAFVAGLVTSLHCAGMCGPLACSLMPMRGDRSDARVVSTVYLSARLGAYTALGAAAGGLGSAPLTWFTRSELRWLPWVIVLFFLALALRWDRFIPKPSFAGRWVLRLQGVLRGMPRTRAAAALGLATPLLPCGPLYFLVALALLSGSALRGAEFMLAFGLGTVPLLWLVQTQFYRVNAWLSPAWAARGRIILSLSAAAVIGWRLRATLGFAGPDPASLICF